MTIPTRSMHVRADDGTVVRVTAGPDRYTISVVPADTDAADAPQADLDWRHAGMVANALLTPADEGARLMRRASHALIDTEAPTDADIAIADWLYAEAGFHERAVVTAPAGRLSHRERERYRSAIKAARAILREDTE